MLGHPDLRDVSPDQTRDQAPYLVFIEFRDIIATSTFGVRMINEKYIVCNTPNGWVAQNVVVVLEVRV